MQGVCCVRWCVNVARVHAVCQRESERARESDRETLEEEEGRRETRKESRGRGKSRRTFLKGKDTFFLVAGPVEKDFVEPWNSLHKRFKVCVRVDFTAAGEPLDRRLLLCDAARIRWVWLHDEERPRSVHFQQGWVAQPGSFFYGPQKNDCAAYDFTVVLQLTSCLLHEVFITKLTHESLVFHELLAAGVRSDRLCSILAPRFLGC